MTIHADENEVLASAHHDLRKKVKGVVIVAIVERSSNICSLS
jgi:hypothetical protein